MQEKNNKPRTHTHTHTHVRMCTYTHKHTRAVGQLGDRRTIMSKLMTVTTVCCPSLLLPHQIHIDYVSAALSLAGHLYLNLQPLER